MTADDRLATVALDDRDLAAEAAVDGRHRRRDRNRDAVVDALLALYTEGRLDPSSAEIAERAGLSPRSLFRYFDDVDDLCQAAINEQQRRVMPTAMVDASPDDPFAHRVEVIITQRLAVFHAMGTVGAVSRLRAPFQSIVADELAGARALLRAQLNRLFRPELAAMTKSRATGVLAVADVVCSFEAYHLMRDDQGLTDDQIVGALQIVLTGLLS